MPHAPQCCLSCRRMPFRPQKSILTTKRMFLQIPGLPGPGLTYDHLTFRNLRMMKIFVLDDCCDFAITSFISIITPYYYCRLLLLLLENMQAQEHWEQPQAAVKDSQTLPMYMYTYVYIYIYLYIRDFDVGFSFPLS